MRAVANEGTRLPAPTKKAPSSDGAFSYTLLIRAYRRGRPRREAAAILALRRNRRAVFNTWVVDLDAGYELVILILEFQRCQQGIQAQSDARHDLRLAANAIHQNALACRRRCATSRRADR